MMNIDEAIKHEEIIADACKEQANMQGLNDPYAKKVAYENGKCAEEHKQIAEWLKELKQLKEQKPCEDCVSRVDLIDKLEIIDKGYGSDFYWEVRKIVDSLPSVKPVACIGTVKFNKEDMQELVDDAVKELKTMTDDRAICKDCVDRSDVISMIMNLNLKHIHSFSRGIGQKAFEDLLNETQALSSVTPTHKKGKWITKYHGFPPEPTLVCSECGFDRDFNINTRGFGKIKYCPNCGTKMEEE